MKFFKLFYIKNIFWNLDIKQWHAGIIQIKIFKRMNIIGNLFKIQISNIDMPVLREIYF